MPAGPSVSVIIPVYNREDTILYAVRSAVNQTLPPLEIIVVDDCSTDSTAAVVEEFARTEPRVRLIRHKVNRHASAARNTGVDEARGTWIATLDSDDTWKPEKLERQLARVREWEAEHGELPGLVYCSTVMVYGPNSRPVMSSEAEGRDPGGILKRFAVIPSASLVRRDVWQDLGGMDPRIRLAEDMDFALRLAERYPVAVVREPLVEMDRTHRERLTTGGGDPTPFLRRWWWKGLRLAGPARFSYHVEMMARSNDTPKSRHRAVVLALYALLMWPFRLTAWRTLGAILLRWAGLKRDAWT